MSKYTNEGVKKPFYKCEEFWGSVIAAAVPVINIVFDLGLDTAQVVTIMVPFLLWVINEIIVNEEEASLDIEKPEVTVTYHHDEEG